MADIIGGILFVAFLIANVLAVMFMERQAPEIRDRVANETPATPKLSLDSIERSLDAGRTLRSQMLRRMFTLKRMA